MSTAGIITLIIGAGIIIASFFIPDKGDRETKQDIEKKREQVRRLLETELDSMKLRVNEATNETVEFGMEKSERALEKITNDKIMAISEYSATVLEEIDRNHKEVVFLYDMLNDKQTDVKNTVRHAEAAVREAEDAAIKASDTAVYASNVADAVNEAVTEAKTDADMLTAGLNAGFAQGIPAAQVITTPGSNTQSDFVNAQETFARVSAPAESVFDMAAREGISDINPTVIEPLMQANEQPEPERELTEFEKLERSTSFNNINNSNQMILKLSGEGMSAVDIARQLSLGVGEVQLVIDLFK